MTNPATPAGWHEVVATCTTTNCPAHGRPTPTVAPDQPGEHHWQGVICAGCEQPTDITEGP